MAHERKRFAFTQFRKMFSFWPIVGVIGVRQVGKTTFITKQLGFKNLVTFDDDDVRETAEKSAKAFVGTLERETVIDEVQKVPKIFDALKSIIDKNRRPGSFTVSGSSQFSSRIGIRESPTGRIGVLQIFPLTIAEIEQKEFLPIASDPLKSLPRFSISEFAYYMAKGGVPVPLFSRDQTARQMYWQSWFETTVYRDLARCFKGRFDPDFAARLLRNIGAVLQNGELPTLQNLNGEARKLRVYLDAFETILVLRKLSPHELAQGKEVWLPFDSGFAAYLMSPTQAHTLSLARIQLLNETSARMVYSGVIDERCYYKSARGSPIDWIWHGTPFKIIDQTRALGWEERALAGCMKKIGANKGFLIGPIDKPHVPKNGIGYLPWSFWS